MAEANSAARAEQAVRALTGLNTARSGVDQEIIPVLSLAVVDDPATAAALGIPPAFQEPARRQAVAAVREARATTDSPSG